MSTEDENVVYATKEEMSRAIEAQLRQPDPKITAVAHWIVNKHPAMKVHMTDDDLMQQAYVAALGPRQWKPAEVDFATFITGVMSSIASNESRKAAHTLPDIKYGEDEHQQDGITSTVTSEKILTPDEEMLQAEVHAAQEVRLAILRAKLEPNELKILNYLLIDQLPKHEIRIKMGMTEKQYKAADRKLMRAIEKLGDPIYD